MPARNHNRNSNAPRANVAPAIDARLLPFLNALAEALAFELMRVPEHNKPKEPTK